MALIAFILALVALAAVGYVAYRQTAINMQLAARINQLIEKLNERQASEPERVPQPAMDAVPAVETVEQPRHEAAMPQVPSVLYLSRADAGGVFLRHSATLLPGNSIFELRVNSDGATGAFSVIDDKAVMSFALMMPTQNLTTACEGSNIQVSGNAHVIVTDIPGIAILRDGKWQVNRPATIHYE